MTASLPPLPVDPRFDPSKPASEGAIFTDRLVPIPSVFVFWRHASDSQAYQVRVADSQRCVEVGEEVELTVPLDFKPDTLAVAGGRFRARDLIFWALTAGSDGLLRVQVRNVGEMPRRVRLWIGGSRLEQQYGKNIQWKECR